VRVVDVLHRLQRHQLVGGEMRQKQRLDLLFFQRRRVHGVDASDLLHEHGLAGSDDQVVALGLCELKEEPVEQRDRVRWLPLGSDPPAGDQIARR